MKRFVSSSWFVFHERSARISGAALLIAVSAGCHADSAVSVGRAPEEVYWSLTMTKKAVTVALDGTDSLSATPRNMKLDSLPGLPAPTFRSLDSTKVRVSASGAVTGVALTTGVGVVAQMTSNGITNYDTTVVAVTALPSSIGTFSLAPIAPDSAKLGTQSVKPLRLIVRDTLGNPVTGLAVHYKSLNRMVATISGTSLRGLSKGTVGVVATTTAYGVTRADTVQFTVTYPKKVSATVLDPPTGVNPGTIILGVNGIVTFTSYLMDTITLTFDSGVENVAGGDLTLDPFDPQTRKFTAPGTYVYRNPAGDVTGKVIVLPD